MRLESIVNEVDSTEEKLAAGNLVMSDLLDQVRVSEQSNAMVVQKMEGLRESAGKMQNQYVNNTADNFNGIPTSTQNIAQQVAQLKETVEIVTEENRLVSEQIENVSEIMQRVMNGANSTYETCNVNLESVANVATVMDNLGAEAERLNR